jgi:hypothetical protein
MITASNQKRTFYIVLGVMILVHASLMVWHIRDHFSLPSVSRADKTIKLKLIQEAMKELAMSEKRQIVQSEDAASQEKVKDAYLSDKDRKFDRQTVARAIDRFQKAAQGDAAITQKAQPRISSSQTSVWRVGLQFQKKSPGRRRAQAQKASKMVTLSRSASQRRMTT